MVISLSKKLNFILVEVFYYYSSDKFSFVVPDRSLLLRRKTSDWNYNTKILAGINVKYL